MKEIETKILEFDELELRQNLKKAGAIYKGKVLMKRVVFDVRPETTEEDEIIRVRSDGKKTTLTWKYRDNRIKKLDNTDEVEVEVNDFNKTVEIISKLWNGVRPYRQETLSEDWEYGGVEVSIRTWPLIPAFLEVEGPTEEKVRRAIKGIGIIGEDVGHASLAMIFKRYKQDGKDAGDLSFG